MKSCIRNSGVCFFLAIIFFSGTLHAQKKKSEKSLLWRISGNGLKDSSYLFGAYHLLGDKFLAEVPETAQPCANAKGVVVELILDSVNMMSVTMSKIMDRNLNWIKALPDLMKSGSQFIAVGAGRLSGPDGLITLLRKQGYSVAVTK